MSWIEEFIKRVIPGLLGGGVSHVLAAEDGATNDTAVNNVLNKAEEDPLSAQGELSKNGYQMTPEQEKWLDNLISGQNTQSARDWEEKMASSDILRAASQLEQVGLSASGVLSTGGSGVNGVAAADNVKSNMAMQRYSQKMALAKQLLSMTSQMASAGVYGSALGAAKQASSVVTSAASHSAYEALNESADLYRNYTPKRHRRVSVDNWGIE